MIRVKWSWGFLSIFHPFNLCPNTLTLHFFLSDSFKLYNNILIYLLTLCYLSQRISMLNFNPLSGSQFSFENHDFFNVKYSIYIQAFEFLVQWFSRRRFLNIFLCLSVIKFEPFLGQQFFFLRWSQYLLFNKNTSFCINISISGAVVLQKKVFQTFFLHIDMGP